MELYKAQFLDFTEYNQDMYSENASEYVDNHLVAGLEMSGNTLQPGKLFVNGWHLEFDNTYTASATNNNCIYFTYESLLGYADIGVYNTDYTKGRFRVTFGESTTPPAGAIILQKYTGGKWVPQLNGRLDSVNGLKADFTNNLTLTGASINVANPITNANGNLNTTLDDLNDKMTELTGGGITEGLADQRYVRGIFINNHYTNTDFDGMNAAMIFIKLLEEQTNRIGPCMLAGQCSTSLFPNIHNALKELINELTSFQLTNGTFTFRLLTIKETLGGGALLEIMTNNDNTHHMFAVDNYGSNYATQNAEMFKPLDPQIEVASITKAYITDADVTILKADDGTVTNLLSNIIETTTVNTSSAHVTGKLTASSIDVNSSIKVALNVDCDGKGYFDKGIDTATSSSSSIKGSLVTSGSVINKGKFINESTTNLQGNVFVGDANEQYVAGNLTVNNGPTLSHGQVSVHITGEDSDGGGDLLTPFVAYGDSNSFDNYSTNIYYFKSTYANEKPSFVIGDEYSSARDRSYSGMFKRNTDSGSSNNRSLIFFSSNGTDAGVVHTIGTTAHRLAYASEVRTQALQSEIELMEQLVEQQTQIDTQSHQINALIEGKAMPKSIPDSDLVNALKAKLDIKCDELKALMIEHKMHTHECELLEMQTLYNEAVNMKAEDEPYNSDHLKLVQQFPAIKEQINQLRSEHEAIINLRKSVDN